MKRLRSDRIASVLDCQYMEATLAARFTELQEAGLDELFIMNMQIADPEIEQIRLMRLIGQV